MFCQNCGKEVVAGAKFCNACGSPMETEFLAPEQLQPEDGETVLFCPAQADAADVPETPQTEVEPDAAYAAPVSDYAAPVSDYAAPVSDYAAPVSDYAAPVSDYAAYAAPEAAEAPILTGKKNRGKSLIVLGVLAVALVALVIGVIKVVPSMLGGKASYLYKSEDGELMFMKKLSAKTDAVELGDEGAQRVQFSDDGKYLYFHTMGADLYVIQTAKAGKKDAEPEKISSDVAQWNLLGGGKVAYTREGQLRYYDGKESTKLCSGVNSFETADGYAYFSEANSAIDGKVGTICRIKLSAGGQKEKLVSDVDILYTSKASQPLIFGRANGDVDSGTTSYETSYETTYDIYTAKNGEAEEKILSDVTDIYGVQQSDAQASFYYTTMQTKDISLYDFVSDSMASSDAKQKMPSTEDYQTYEEYYYYGYGNWTTDWDAYYDAMEKWEPVGYRDDLREQLISETYAAPSYTLMHYEKGKETEVTKGIAQMVGKAALDGVFLYTKDDSKVRAVIDLKDLKNIDQLYELTREASVLYQNVGGKESELQTDEDYTIQGIVGLNDTTAILRGSDTHSQKEVLLDYAVGKQGLTFAGTVTDDPFSSACFETLGNGKRALYYFEDFSNSGNAGTLICYLDGKKTVIAKDVATVYALEDGKTYFTMDGDDTASLVKNGKATRIGDDISRIFIMGEQRVAYISDNDLYFWNGSKSERVATDVSEFWCNEQAVKSTFYC